MKVGSKAKPLLPTSMYSLAIATLISVPFESGFNRLIPSFPFILHEAESKVPHSQGNHRFHKAPVDPALYPRPAEAVQGIKGRSGTEVVERRQMIRLRQQTTRIRERLGERMVQSFATHRTTILHEAATLAQIINPGCGPGKQTD